MRNTPSCRLPLAALLLAAAAAEPRAHAQPATSPAASQPSPPLAPGPLEGAPPAGEPPLVDPAPSPEPEPRAAAGEPPRGVLTEAEEKGPVKRLQLPDAIKRALRQHPQVLAAREETRAAEARIGVAQSRYYPRVDGWLEYVRASENAGPSSFYSVPGLARVTGSQRDGVGWHHSFNNFLVAAIAQQVIYDFGRTQGQVGAARARAKAAKMREELIEQQVAFDVIRSFYAVRSAREAVRIAEEALHNAEGIFELASTSAKTGLRPPSEKSRAEADVAAAEVALIRARLDLDVARARVANAIGAAGEAIEPADEALPPLEAVPAAEASIEVALANRPELRALDLHREALTQTLRGVKAQQYPRIDAILGVNSRGQFLPAAGQDPFHRFNWSAGVVVNVPMFQGLAVRKEKQAIQADIHALDDRKEAVRQAVILEVKEVVAVVQAADEAERASRKGVEAAKAALEVSQGRYRAGLGTLIELTDAQATYVSARSQAVQSRYNRHIARAALDLALGTNPGATAKPPAAAAPR